MYNFDEIDVFKYQGFSKEQAREMYDLAKSYTEVSTVSIEDACKTILLMYKESKMSEEKTNEIIERLNNLNNIKNNT